MSQKASEYSCVPLTAEEYLEYHRVGKESFEMSRGLRFSDVVRNLNRTWFNYAELVK